MATLVSLPPASSVDLARLSYLAWVSLLLALQETAFSYVDVVTILKRSPA